MSRHVALIPDHFQEEEHDDDDDDLDEELDDEARYNRDFDEMKPTTNHHMCWCLTSQM